MNGEGAEYTYNCPRCGNEMSSKSRYCMKCGYLNPSHPDNQQFSKYIKKAGKQEYVVGNDGVSRPQFQVNANEVNKKSVELAFGSHMGNFTLCFAINFLLYLALVGAAGFFFYQMSGGSLPLFFASEVSYVVGAISIISLMTYSTQLVYMKMNYPWWTAFIPLVNLYVLSDALMGQKRLLNLLVFVPVIGQIYLLYLMYKLGQSFKYNGLLTVLFPFIMFPIIGFGGSAFNGLCYVNGRDSLEKEYTKKKSFLVTSVILIVSSLVLLVYSNTVTINRSIDKFSSYYLYYASQKVARRTKLKVESKNYTCNYHDNVMYFHFKDLSDNFFLPFYVYRDPIEAYVKVVVTPGGEDEFLDKYEYYISMTDGRYGYKEVAVDELKIEDIDKFPELDKTYENACQCDFGVTP